MSLARGAVVDRYVIEELVGTGGMGAVYRARDPETGTPVALKFLRSPERLHESARAAREARVLASLQHPGIVAYRGHGETAEGVPYLVMEWLVGEDLGTRLARGPLSLAESLVVLRRTADPLATAHAQGIVHRDLKPSNLFLRDGKLDDVAILDFGVARASTESNVITSEGNLVGTPTYMAPEQAAGAHELTAAVDVFALGCVFFECLTGRTPFEADQLQTMLARVLFSEPTRLRHLCPELPPAAEYLVERMLAKEPSTRIFDARELIHTLATLEPELELATPPGPTFTPRGRTTQDQPALPLGRRPWPAAPALAPVAPPPVSERKLISACACAVTNHADLAERVTPEALQQLVDDLHELGATEVAKLGGTMVELRHDGFLALFGVPLTREGHAAGAVLAASVIARRASERGLQVSFGVSSGVVSVRSAAGVHGQRYAANGDAIGLAAGLMAQAGPGEIWLGDATVELVRRHVEVETLAPQTLRGRSAPVRAHRVLVARPRPDAARVRARSAFVGRAAEVAALHAHLRRLSEGHGQFVGIVGEPGSGKSRLLLELRGQLPAEVRYLEGACLAHGTTVPYLPLVEVVARWAGLDDGDRDGRVIEKVERAVASLGIDAPEVAPYLLDLLQVPAARTQLAGLSGEAIRARTFRALRTVLKAEARRQPLVLAIEDLHWTDRTTEHFLSSLLETSQQDRLLVVATYRPECRPIWSELAHAARLELAPLTAEAAAEVLRWYVQGGLGASVERELLERAGGNAFFLEELARTAGESAPAAVPASVHGVIMARIDRLPAEAKRLLLTASVVGREVPLGLLARIWDRPAVLSHLLDELSARGFLESRDGAGEPVHVFKHALTEEVAYAGLVAPTRRALHAAVARALEVQHADRLEVIDATLGHHYGRAEMPDRAVEHLQRAAVRAAGVHAHAEAIGLLEQALTLAERLDGPGRDRTAVALVNQMPRSFWSLGRFADARAVLERERARVDAVADPALAGPYWAWLGLMCNYLDDREAATSCANAAVAAASRCGDVVTEARAYYVLAAEGYVTGRFRDGAAWATRAAALLEPTRERWWFAQTSWMVGVNLTLMGEFEAALPALQTCLAVSQELGDPRLEGYATQFMCLLLATAGEAEAAIAMGERAASVSPDVFTRTAARGFLGNAYREQGDGARALPYLLDARERSVQFKVRRIEAWFTMYAADAYLRLGEHAKARELALAASEISRAVNFGFATGFAQRVLGEVATRCGDLDEARHQLLAALETYGTLANRFEQGRCHLALRSLALAAGDDAAAEAHLATAASLFARPHVARYVELAERLRSASRPAARISDASGRSSATS